MVWIRDMLYDEREDGKEILVIAVGESDIQSFALFAIL